MNCNVVYEINGMDDAHSVPLRDFVARSKVGTTGTFADVIIGTTEKSLALLSGGNCSPESVFVIKKGNGTPANIAY